MEEFYKGLYHIGDVCSSRSKNIINKLSKAFDNGRIDVWTFKELVGDLEFLSGFGDGIMQYATNGREEKH